MSEREQMEQRGLSVVIGSYNRKAYLKIAVKTVREELAKADFPYEIIIVDGGSSDGSMRWLSKQKDIVTIIQHNRGIWRGQPVKRRSWGYFMNLGFKSAQGKYICMLSDDCLVVPGAIINGYNLFEQKLSEGEKVGALAFYWRNFPEHNKYWVGLTLGNKMFVNHGLYLRKALESVGFIDEDTFLFYHADGDLCLKLWNTGFACLASENSFIEHFSHASYKVRTANNENQQKDWNNFLKKWEGIFYNPDENNFGDWIYSDKVPDNDIAKKYIGASLSRYLGIKLFLKMKPQVSK